MATSDIANTAPRSSPSPTNNGTRWSIAFLLGPGTLSDFVDRVNLPVAHDGPTPPANCPVGALLDAVGVAVAPFAIPL